MRLLKLIFISISIFSILFLIYLGYVYWNKNQSIPTTTVKDTDPPYLYSCNPNGLQCEVYLSSTIWDQAKYRQIFLLIENSPSTQDINIHLAGNGGDMNSVVYFYNAIKKSKSKVTMVVEGPVYSAHAFLSMVGTSIDIADGSFFMFHKPAVYNSKINEFVSPLLICKVLYGKKDREQDLVKKCEDRMNNEGYIYTKIFESTFYKYLTKDEIDNINKGDDIFIKSDDMRKRINNHARN